MRRLRGCDPAPICSAAAAAAAAGRVDQGGAERGLSLDGYPLPPPSLFLQNPPVIQNLDVLRSLQDFYHLDRIPTGMRLTDIAGLMPSSYASVTKAGSLHAGSSGTFGGETVDFEAPPLSADPPTFRCFGRPTKDNWTTYTISYYLATGAPINYVRITVYDPNVDAVDVYEDITPAAPAYGTGIVVDSPPGYTVRVSCGGTTLSGFEVDALWRYTDGSGPPS